MTYFQYELCGHMLTNIGQLDTHLKRNAQCVEKMASGTHTHTIDQFKITWNCNCTYFDMFNNIIIFTNINTNEIYFFKPSSMNIYEFIHFH